MTTPDTGYRANLQRLNRAQKPSVGTAAYSRLVNRPLGRRVAAAAALVGMTPNTASVISASLSGTALLLVVLAEPTWIVGLLAAVLLAAGYVMDSVDGQLARLAGTGSLAGEWLDHTIDCFKTSLIHVAVLVSWYRFPPLEDRAVLAVPLVYGVVQAVTYFGLILMPLLRAKGLRPTVEDTSGSAPAAEHPLRTWLLLPTDYGAFVWSFALLGAPVVFVVTYTALCGLNSLALMAALRKWWRELRRLDAAAAASTTAS